MPAGFYDSRFLNSARIQTIIEEAGSLLERQRPLTFLDRLNLVDATNDELMGRFRAKVLAADIIADGQKAVVYDAGQVTLFTQSLPNVKIGQHLNQAQIDALERLSQIPRAQDEDAWEAWERSLAENLLQGIRERLNSMAVGMMIDDYDYDRWGIQLSDVTWGMPSNLKVTPSTPWSTAASATPIADILAMDEVDALNYGLGPFNRVTMSSTAFFYMTATTEFQNKANLFSGINFALAAGYLATNDRKRMLDLAGNILQKELVIDDKTIREQNNAGVVSPAKRVLPANKVLLDRTENGPREWDMGNGVVTESIVAGLIGNVTLGTNPQMAGGGARGPLAYYTPQDQNLNPPGLIGWAVQRAFPRKKVPESSAVLTVY